MPDESWRKFVSGVGLCPENLLDPQHVFLGVYPDGIKRRFGGIDIDAMIEEDPISRVRLRVPQKEGKTLAMLEAKARIFSRAYKDGAVELEVEAPESVVRKTREWVVKGRS